jgi:hypothetical protein
VYREGVTFFGKFYLDHFYSQLASALNRPKRMWASYWAAALQHRATRTFSTPKNSFSPRKTSVNVYRNFFSVILLKFALKIIIWVVFTNFFYLHERWKRYIGVGKAIVTSCRPYSFWSFVTLSTKLQNSTKHQNNALVKTQKLAMSLTPWDNIFRFFQNLHCPKS